MLRNALVWALRSPTRLSILAIAVLVVGLSLIVVAHHDRPATTQTGRVVVIEHSASPSIQSSVAETQAPASVRPARTAARRFLGFYLRPQGNKSRIDPSARRWATPQLWVGLRVADPRLLPNARLRELKPRAVGTFEADFVARLRDDSTLILSVVRVTKGWVVSDIEPGRPSP